MVARLPAYPPTRGARRPRRAIHLPGVPPGARAYPAGAPISSRRNGGKEGPGGFPPFQKGGFAWIFIEGAPGAFDPGPPVRGLLAAVGCTDRAKTSRALPPAPLAGACGNWGPRRSPAKRVRWGEFPGEAPPVADKASRKKGAARLAGHFGPGIAMPRREQGPSGGNELSTVEGVSFAACGEANDLKLVPTKRAAMHGRSLPCLYSPPPPWTPGPGPAGPGGFPTAFDIKSGAPAGQARPRGSPGKWNAGGWYPPLRAWRLPAPRGVDTPANERRVRDAAPYRVRLGEGGSV